MDVWKPYEKMSVHIHIPKKALSFSGDDRVYEGEVEDCVEMWDIWRDVHWLQDNTQCFIIN